MRHHRTRIDLGGERGSLPMVMLAAIIMGGIIIALSTSVMTGTDTARRDRDWQAAVQVADAGIQQAFVVLRDMDEGDTVAPCDTDGDGTCEGTLDDGETFVWEYGLSPGSTTQWDVTSRGESGGSTRVLSANVGPRQLFPVAMLAKTHLTYNGGGGGNPPFAIGSFGTITLNGTPANNSIASIVKYGPGPHSVSAASGHEIQNAPNWDISDLNNIAQEAFEDPNLCGPGTTRPFYEVYPASVVAAGQTPGVRGTTYCVGRVEFLNDTYELSGTGGPVSIYVRNAGTADSFRVRTQAEVNFPGGTMGEPDEHLFFIESGPVRFSANSEFAGGVYAPNSTCDASGNQVIVGSLVCNDITVGGTFGYATGLLGLTEGPFAVNSYWENSASS